jgi:hypothetical protein
MQKYSFNLNAMLLISATITGFGSSVMCPATRKWLTWTSHIYNQLLALLLYILLTRVDEIHAHTFLIHMHTSSFIMHSFSLTLNSYECIPLVLVFLDTLSLFVEVTHLPSLGYAKTVGRLTYCKRQQCNHCLYANKPCNPKCMGYSRK